MSGHSNLIEYLGGALDSAPTSLNAHDKRYHGGHFDAATMKCERREDMSGDDETDNVEAVAETLERTHEWMRVRWVSPAVADRMDLSGRDYRLAVTPADMQVAGAFWDDHFDGRNNHCRNVILSQRPLPVMQRCFARQFGKRYERDATQGVHRLDVRIHPNLINPKKHSDSDHLNREEFCNILTSLDDPIAVLPPTENHPDQMMFIFDIERYGKKMYAAVPIMLVDSDFDSKDDEVRQHPEAYLRPMTGYVLYDEKRFVGKNGKMIEAAYVDDTRRDDLRRLGIKEPEFSRLGHDSSKGAPGPVLNSGLPTLTKSNFADQRLGIVADYAECVNWPSQRLVSEYEEAYKKGDRKAAREIMDEYARRKGFFMHTVPRIDAEGKEYAGKEFSEYFYLFDESIRKSDDFETDEEGKLIPLDRRFDVRQRGGSREDFLNGKRNGKARKYEQAYRAFHDGNGDIAGWYNRNRGDVTLVRGRATAETAAHEIGWHATYHWAEKYHPALYETLRRYAENATESVRSAVRRRYGADLSADELLDEIGAERFTRHMMGKIADAAERRKTSEWWDGVESGIDDTRRVFVKESRPKNLKKHEVDELAKLPPEQAVESLVCLLLGGRSLPHVMGGAQKNAALRYLEMTRAGDGS